MLILLYHQCIFHNMKIVFYTIAKNEEKFVERWYKSMKEADELYVLDTGSTDKTVNKLKKFKECEKLIRKSLRIKINERSYINEVFTFDHSAYDMLSLIYDSKHEYKKALFYVRKSLKISPND